jgi:Golgi phosphoprotein 3 GPP34
MRPPAPSLTLTDDFWLAAHDTVSGRPQMAAVPLGIGLAAGLLGELLFTGHITISKGLLYLQSAVPPEDPALVPLVAQLDEEERGRRQLAVGAHEESGHDLYEWIRYLAIEDRAAQLVTNRLSRSGSVTLEQRRKLFGGSTSRFVPRDSYVSGVPASRILTGLQRREQLDPQTLVLAGLFLATGLHQQALESLTPSDRADLAHQLRGMHPMLRELLRAAEQIVGEAVMTR